MVQYKPAAYTGACSGLSAVPVGKCTYKTIGGPVAGFLLSLWANVPTRLLVACGGLSIAPVGKCTYKAIANKLRLLSQATAIYKRN